jgi:hypothetical protein
VLPHLLPPRFENSSGAQPWPHRRARRVAGWDRSTTPQFQGHACHSVGRRACNSRIRLTKTAASAAASSSPRTWPEATPSHLENAAKNARNLQASMFAFLMGVAA